MERSLLCLIAAAAIEKGTADPLDVFEVMIAGADPWIPSALMEFWDEWTTALGWPHVLA